MLTSSENQGSTTMAPPIAPLVVVQWRHSHVTGCKTSS